MNVLIFSDYEPDDFLALMLLALLHAADNVQLVITENKLGTLIAKCADAAHHFPTFRVLRGAESNVVYNFVWDRAVRDGKHIPIYDDKIDDVPIDRVYGLAPFRDLVRVVASYPDRFARTQAFLYGGFNFGKVTPPVDWNAFCTAFARVTIVESRVAFGEQFTFTRDSGPLLPLVMAKAEAGNALAMRLISLASSWNAHLAVKMRTDIGAVMLNSLTPHGANVPIPWNDVLRKIDIARAIEADPHQILAADAIVALLASAPDAFADELRPVILTWNKEGRVAYVPIMTPALLGGQIPYAPAVQSNVVLFLPKNGDVAKAQVEQHITAILSHSNP